MRFADLKIKWKITLVAALVFLPVMAIGTLYFYQQVYWLEVRNALGGLCNLFSVNFCWRGHDAGVTG